MKLALLLPGYLDSPDYLHMTTFEKGLAKMGYHTQRIDPCILWSGGDPKNYTITNYIQQISQTIDSYKPHQVQEIVLIGHSLGGFTAIIAGNRIKQVTKIIALCPPPDRLGSTQKWQGKEFRVSQRNLPTDSTKQKTFRIPISFTQDGRQYSAVKEVQYIHKPLMILIALDDQVVAPERTEKIVAKAHNPHVVRQKNLGHDFRHSQTQTNIVWKHIQSFLN